MLNVKPRLGLDWGQIFELDVHGPKRVTLTRCHHQEDGSPFIVLRLGGESPADQEVSRYYRHSDLQVLEREVALLQEGLTWLREQLGAVGERNLGEMTPRGHLDHHGFVARAEQVFTPPTNGSAH